MKDTAEEVSSRQSLHLAVEIARMLHDLGAHDYLVQGMINSRSHPTWKVLESVLKDALVAETYTVGKKVRYKILKPVSTLVIPAQPAFNVKEKFKKGNGEVEFSEDPQLWEVTENEEPVKETEVSIHRLSVEAAFSAIDPELPKRPFLTFSQLFWMLKQQPRGGENGNLRTFTGTNILKVLNGKAVQIFDVAWCPGFSGGGVSVSSGWFVRRIERAVENSHVIFPKE